MASELRQLYISEMQEQRSAEEQLIQALPKMAEWARGDALAEAIQEHLRETRQHLDHLDGLLAAHEVDPRAHSDDSMTALIVEAEKWAKAVDDHEARDAALISSAQRIEHYEIAVYGTLATWAKQLGLEDDLEVLLGILDQEKSANDKLSHIAKSEANPQAAH